MSDLISRQALCEYALNQKDKSVTPNDIMRFPSAQLATDINVGDTISRQQAIDAMGAINDGICEQQAIDALCELPSAQPERKKGKWIWWYEEAVTKHATEYTPHCKCSECGRECAPSVATSSNFCPNCGADMRDNGDE